MTLVDTRSLRFHHLEFLEERDEVVVGRRDIDSYAVMPPDGAALLRQLVEGRAPAEAAIWYREQYGEPVDVDDFLSTLQELDFFRTDAGEDEVRTVRWQRLGRALFSGYAWGLFAALIAGALVAFALDPRMVPRRHNVFFSSSLIAIELATLVGQTALTLVHELFHVLAGRRLGIRSRVRISQRLHFVVFETALDGLVAVPRAKRYLPILAGLLADVLVVAVLTLVAFVATRGSGASMPLGAAVCLSLAFTTLPRIAWQFYLFLRTDLYYFFTTLLRCVDLQTTTRELLRNRWNKLLGRRDRLVDESRWHPRDFRVARWYVPAMVAGYAVSIGMLVVVVVPLAFRFLSTAVRRLLPGGASDAAQALDSAAFLALTLLQLGLAAALALRERRQRLRPASKGDPT